SGKTCASSGTAMTSIRTWNTPGASPTSSNSGNCSPRTPWRGTNRAAGIFARNTRLPRTTRSATTKTSLTSRPGSLPATTIRPCGTSNRSPSRKCIRLRGATNEELQIMGATLNLTLKVWRQPSAAAPGEFRTYKVYDISPDMSFLEMLDVLNQDLAARGEEPVAFDHDCREGICGACSLM